MGGCICAVVNVQAFRYCTNDSESISNRSFSLNTYLGFGTSPTTYSYASSVSLCAVSRYSYIHPPPASTTCVLPFHSCPLFPRTVPSTQPTQCATENENENENANETAYYLLSHDRKGSYKKGRRREGGGGRIKRKYERFFNCAITKCGATRWEGGGFNYFPPSHLISSHLAASPDTTHTII